MYSAIVKPYYVLSLHTGPRSAVLCIIRIVLYYVLIRIMYCGTLVRTADEGTREHSGIGGCLWRGI